MKTLIQCLYSILLFMVCANVAAASKRVLIIESYHAEYSWDASYIKGITATLGSDYEIITFEMDTKRLPKDHFQEQADKAWNVFLNTKPDVVILGDDNALKLLGKKLNDSGTPVVFLGVNENPRHVGVIDMRNVTGVLERPLFRRNIVEINKIMANKITSVLILFDSGITSHTAVNNDFQGKDTLKIGKIHAVLKLIDTQSEWQNAVLNAKKDGFDAIIIGLFQTLINSEKNHVDANEILAWTSQNSPVPPFAFWDFVVGKKQAIGGLVLFGEVQGIEAAKLVKKIIAGSPPSSLGIVTADKGRFLFSRSELAKWHLKLPQRIEKVSDLID